MRADPKLSSWLTFSQNLSRLCQACPGCFTELHCPLLSSEQPFSTHALHMHPASQSLKTVVLSSLDREGSSLTDSSGLARGLCHSNCKSHQAKPTLSHWETPVRLRVSLSGQWGANIWMEAGVVQAAGPEAMLTQKFSNVKACKWLMTHE